MKRFLLLWSLFATPAVAGNLSMTACLLSGTTTSCFLPVAITSGGTGAVTKAAGFDALSPMSIAGDIIYGGTSGTGTRLGIGTNGQPLRAGTTSPAYGWNGVNAVSSADYVVTTTDGYGVIAVSTGASNRTVTLPAAASSSGRPLEIVKTDNGVGKVIVARAGSDTIGGDTQFTITAQYGHASIIGDGTNWQYTTEVMEHGTWTPALSCVTSNGSWVLTPTLATFTRAGKWVTVFSSIVISGTVGVASGTFRFSGLPYTTLNGTGAGAQGTAQNPVTAAYWYVFSGSNSTLFSWYTAAQANVNCTGITTGTYNSTLTYQIDVNQ